MTPRNAPGTYWDRPLAHAMPGDRVRNIRNGWTGTVVHPYRDADGTPRAYVRPDGMRTADRTAYLLASFRPEPDAR